MTNWHNGAGVGVLDARYLLESNNLSDLVDASTARTNLGLAIGTDIQAWDTQLDDLSGLAVTDGNIIVGDGVNWVAENGATARASLGVTIGSNVQAWDDDLDDIAALTPTKGNLLVGNGTDWIALGVGTDTHVLTADSAEVSGTKWAVAGAASSPWTTDTNVVNLNTDTDTVTIGSATAGGKLFIDGDADEIQLQVQGNSTQTANLMTVETSAGTDKFQILSTGAVRVDAANAAGDFAFEVETSVASAEFFRFLNSSSVSIFELRQSTAGDATFRLLDVSSNIVCQMSGAIGPWYMIPVSSGTDYGLMIGSNKSTTSMLEVMKEDSGTTDVYDVLTVARKSTGTPAAGLGAATSFLLESSTTIDQAVGRISYEWATATHATRKALSKWTVYDTAEREGLRIEADGSSPMIGFLGTTAVAQQSGTGETTGFTAGAGTGVNDDSTFTGNVGATAYRISDVVKALKNYGLLAS